MTWAETIVQSLKNWDTSLVAYVPDSSIHHVTSIIDDDPFFHLVSAAREEEAIGVAVGSYAVGRNAAVFMQTSGFGNTINAIASLCIPARTPIPFFINMRGGPGNSTSRRWLWAALPSPSWICWGWSTSPLTTTIAWTPCWMER